MDDTRVVTNPECTDGGPDWCCIDGDGTGLWCDSLDVTDQGASERKDSE